VVKGNPRPRYENINYATLTSCTHDEPYIIWTLFIFYFCGEQYNLNSQPQPISNFYS
jgi:hypothetical protein